MLISVEKMFNYSYMSIKIKNKFIRLMIFNEELFNQNLDYT